MATLHFRFGSPVPSDLPLFLPISSTSVGNIASFRSSLASRSPALAAGASTFSGGEVRFSHSSATQFFRPCRRFPRQRRSTVRAKATDYYATLNLSRSATLQEIKSSYRNLARKYHPDMNKGPGSEEKFKEISAAYEVLSDDEKKSLYDRFGEAGLQGEYDGAGVNPQGVDPFEVFSGFFGESNGLFGGDIDPGGINFNTRINRSQGLDIRYDLPLSFEESIFGGRREINVTRFETCDNCNGTGAKSSNCKKTCTECGGRGGVMKTQRTPFGMVSQVSTCSKCGGNGKIITDHCRSCNGEGRIQAERSVRIDIPAGVNDGFTIQIQGEGSFDKKRDVAGDLYLFIHVNNKPGIRRDGLNLYSDITIDYTEAILGSIVKVETVEGYRDLQIPPGTQPGDTLKFANLGAPNIKKPSVRGDHHFIVRVQIPKDISEVERSLVEKLACFRASSEDHSIPSKGTFQASVKKHKTRKRKSQGLRKGAKHLLWSSIKNLFGGNQTGGGFASISVQATGGGFTSISVQAPAPAWIPCGAADPSLVISICGVFVVTFVFKLIGRTHFCLFLQQRKKLISNVECERKVSEQ